ncbi:MAG: pyridoxal phosphate-dependent aminotransferase [Synergistaceae bacterium]|jgi:aspartate aminotransferase|nr:pyridoxal phosphate-dependent aminotransferase [Synergistaceae bacterium]
MHFSDRIKAMQTSPIRRLLPFSDEAKKAGKKVYHLNIGQPDIKTPDGYFEAVRSFKVDTVAYAASQGRDDLRDAIVEYYRAWDIPFERGDVYITNGGSEALWFAVMTICDPGDELLVPEPFYANYNAFAQSALARLVPIPTKAENGFHLPPAQVIEKMITPKTRAIWISNPGNPTGAVYTASELEAITALAKKHDIYIIADEVYREFTYDGEKFTSAGHMKDALDRVIMVDSVSKRFSACGARVGCVAIKNKEFMAQVLKLCQGRLCVSTLEQVGAAALYKTPKSYLEEVNREYKARRDVLYSALKGMDGVVCEEPKGAFYVMVKMPVDDAEKFIIWMLGNYDVNGETMMGAPGNGFYAPGAERGKDEMRLAYVLKKEDLVKAMNVLKGALAAYPGRVEAIKA